MNSSSKKKVVKRAYDRGHFSSSGCQNPKDTLKIEHSPKMRRILLLHHAYKHDG
jgi:hypothetical protein